MTEPGAELAALRQAGDALGLDTSNADLVSSTSRIIWRLPAPAAVVLISRPGSKDLAQVQAEASAVQAAHAAGVRTPTLLAGPAPIAGGRVALAYEWIASRAFEPDDWPPAVRAIRRLANGRSDDLAVLQWPAELPDGKWRDVLGPDVHGPFVERCRFAASEIHALTADRDGLVLSHGDVQPANILIGPDGEPWLIDFEYACLAPPEWDPAKIMILGRRFGDPRGPEELLSAWPQLDQARLARCVTAQETLLVAWLARMAVGGTAGAATEARHRARSLDEGNVVWRHLA